MEAVLKRSTMPPAIARAYITSGVPTSGKTFQKTNPYVAQSAATAKTAHRTSPAYIDCTRASLVLFCIELPLAAFSFHPSEVALEATNFYMRKILRRVDATCQAA